MPVYGGREIQVHPDGGGTLPKSTTISDAAPCQTQLAGAKLRMAGHSFSGGGPFCVVIDGPDDGLGDNFTGGRGLRDGIGRTLCRLFEFKRLHIHFKGASEQKGVLADIGRMHHLHARMRHLNDCLREGIPGLQTRSV